MGKTVLVVDDNAEIRSLITLLLSQDGFKCTEACSAEDALDRLGLGTLPDLIITDYHMDGLSGADMLMLIRSNPVYRSIPVMLVSSDLMAGRIARDSGFDSFVDKPRIAPELAVKARAALAH